MTDNRTGFEVLKSTEITMSSELNIKLVRHCADDLFACEAAQLSTGNHPFGEWQPKENFNPERFLNALMKPRHGVPWEHTFFTFAVQVPIFVARQWVKHRLSSMNELSGRYSLMIPTFYSNPKRPMINIGTKMKPEMIVSSEEVQHKIGSSDASFCRMAWEEYQFRLSTGVAEEYARIVLPLSTYTQFYWSLNGRSLMNFLERRIDDEGNRVETHPQWEIEQPAKQMEDEFARLMPLTHKAFIANGRVAP